MRQEDTQQGDVGVAGVTARVWPLWQRVLMVLVTNQTGTQDSKQHALVTFPVLSQTTVTKL